MHTRPTRLADKDESRDAKITPASDPRSGSSEHTPPPLSFKGDLAKKYRYETTSTAKSRSNSIHNAVCPPPPASKQASKRSRSTATLASTEAAASSPTRPKKKRKTSQYADPSKYAHLSPLLDILEPDLICVFVGTNPGVQTAAQGHAYAHSSNSFWKLLHSSGLTPNRRLSPQEDRLLPALYCMGNTNIVSRPSKDAAELSKEEMTAGAGDLEEKFRKYKPEAVCIVGKGIWEAIWRWKFGRAIRKGEFKWGWQDEDNNMGRCEGEDGQAWKGSWVYVTTSTSGLAASLKPAEKEAIWKPFGEWVQKRRQQRGFMSDTVGTAMDGQSVAAVSS